MSRDPSYGYNKDRKRDEFVDKTICGIAIFILCSICLPLIYVGVSRDDSEGIKIISKQFITCKPYDFQVIDSKTTFSEGPLYVGSSRKYYSTTYVTGKAVIKDDMYHVTIPFPYALKNSQSFRSYIIEVKFMARSGDTVFEATKFYVTDNNCSMSRAEYVRTLHNSLLPLQKQEKTDDR